jgi:hypothetical protein
MTTCSDELVTLMKVVSHRGADQLPSDATAEAGTGEGALMAVPYAAGNPGK